MGNLVLTVESQFLKRSKLFLEHPDNLKAQEIVIPFFSMVVAVVLCLYRGRMWLLR